MKQATPLVLSAVLLGCATAPPELLPDNGESVTLELYESENLVRGQGFVSMHLDDFDCYGFSVPGLTKAADMPATKSISVTGKRFLTISTAYLAVGGGVVKSCSPIYTFAVRPGASYRVIMGNDDKVCSTKVEEIGGSTVELHSRERTTPFSDGNGPWCKADHRFQGSSSLRTVRGARP